MKRFKAIRKYLCLASVDGTNGRRCRCVKVVGGKGGVLVEQIARVD